MSQNTCWLWFSKEPLSFLIEDSLGNYANLFRLLGKWDAGQRTFLVFTFRLFSVQNNAYAKVLHFGVAYSVTLQYEFIAEPS
jgi:hypothetical protein